MAFSDDLQHVNEELIVTEKRALGKGGAKISDSVNKSAKSGMKMDKSEMPGMQATASDTTREVMPSAASPHEMSAKGNKKMDGMNMGGNVSISSKLVVTLITLVMLAGGAFLAARYGDLSMRAGEMEMKQMPMDNMPKN